MVLKSAILRNIDWLRFSHLTSHVSSDNGYAAVTPNVAIRELTLLLPILEVASSNFGPQCGRPDRALGFLIGRCN
jgi:hypothetical protein